MKRTDNLEIIADMIRAISQLPNDELINDILKELNKVYAIDNRSRIISASDNYVELQSSDKLLKWSVRFVPSYKNIYTITINACYNGYRHLLEKVKFDNEEITWQRDIQSNFNSLNNRLEICGVEKESITRSYLDGVLVKKVIEKHMIPSQPINYTACSYKEINNYNGNTLVRLINHNGMESTEEYPIYEKAEVEPIYFNSNIFIENIKNQELITPEEYEKYVNLFEERVSVYKLLRGEPENENK